MLWDFKQVSVRMINNLIKGQWWNYQSMLTTLKSLGLLEKGIFLSTGTLFKSEHLQGHYS